ncbi:putative phosphoinositide phosphatase sac9 [Asimina triloba]
MAEMKQFPEFKEIVEHKEDFEKALSEGANEPTEKVSNSWMDEENTYVTLLNWIEVFLSWVASSDVLLKQLRRGSVGEYRLPEVRSGTPLYFDFPRPIQAHRMCFKLLGDVAAFTDDPTEQDDSDFRPCSLPTGLSLANRIKLYYYADPYELGKWASLSAV